MTTRRKMILGGCALTLLSATGTLAQQGGQMRRIGVLMGYSETDPEAQARIAAFKKRLAALGWNEGRNLRIDSRWTAGDVQRATALAKELIALQPELVMCSTTPTTAALQRLTQTIPVIFTVVSDPVGSGFVKSLARPGGNITGFINIESSLIDKQLQMLKELAPRVNRVAIMYNPDTAPYAEYYLSSLKTAAATLGVQVIPSTVWSEADIDSAVSKLAATAGGGLLVMTDSYMVVHRKRVIALAATHRIPAVYFSGYWAVDGGLISYGIEVTDLFDRAAGYVDRILRGAKPADLPVEQPARFELMVNIKTAKSLGLTIPQTILVRADRVIE